MQAPRIVKDPLYQYVYVRHAEFKIVYDGNIGKLFLVLSGKLFIGFPDLFYIFRHKFLFTDKTLRTHPIVREIYKSSFRLYPVVWISKRRS